MLRLEPRELVVTCGDRSNPRNLFSARGLTITGEKVFVVTNESGKHVEVETFFSFPTEGILAPFLEKFEALYVWQPGTRGMEPFPPAAMFNACLYAKLNGNMTDRELERHLFRHPDIASALGFDSGEVPSHDIISYFKRERLTEDLLGVAFNALRDHLLAIGVIDLASVSVDSAPVSAFANIGKANREVPPQRQPGAGALQGSQLPETSRCARGIAGVQTIYPYPRARPPDVPESRGLIRVGRVSFAGKSCQVPWEGQTRGPPHGSGAG